MVKRTNVRDFREPADQLESENQKSLTERSESSVHLSRFPRATVSNRDELPRENRKGELNTG